MTRSTVAVALVVGVLLGACATAEVRRLRDDVEMLRRSCRPVPALSPIAPATEGILER